MVLDASVLFDALAGRLPDEATAQVASASQLSTPELASLEVLSALRRQLMTGGITPEAAAELVARLRLFDIRRHSHHDLIERVWELRETMTSYDALYVALAESLGTTLLTRDARLAGAPGARCHIQLV